jgi:hypothetical protein
MTRMCFWRGAIVGCLGGISLWLFLGWLLNRVLEEAF